MAIDFETANGSRASACSVAVVRFSGDEEKESYATLIRPPDGHDRFEARNTAIHGIRRTDVVGAPRWPAVWSQLRDFIGDSPVVAHNAAFDTSVIRGANSAAGIRPPTLRYACTLVIARQTWQLDSYTLPRVARAAGIVFGDHHRAEADARAAAKVLVAERREHGVESIDGLLASARVSWGRLHSEGYEGCRKR
ncbi:3'-5' exonuclease [Glycomyces harbinensis]|uniref:DNA polymerase-3 subunit epsilon n=1 Tax=Glycomyces harbinensis TaxID=58114 RepID=A0A1G6RRJ3_9ACTN|nr:3'-5' exonuclease [Glycomyces harbinensis]SDD06587.1 DNA polymerase-3 subunit epsilon [Glycomyces harbinensis]